MNVSFFISLTFWGLLALVLSELITLSVTRTQTGLTWLGYGLWAIAAGMVVFAGIRAVQERRARQRGETRHEL